MLVDTTYSKHDRLNPEEILDCHQLFRDNFQKVNWLLVKYNGLLTHPALGCMVNPTTTPLGISTSCCQPQLQMIHPIPLVFAKCERNSNIEREVTKHSTNHFAESPERPKIALLWKISNKARMYLKYHFLLCFKFSPILRAMHIVRRSRTCQLTGQITNQALPP